jgi:hypothetical protein
MCTKLHGVTNCITILSLKAIKYDDGALPLNMNLGSLAVYFVA